MSEAKKKKRGKPHPFEDRLRATETVLWISGAPTLSLWEEIKTSGFYAVLGLCLVIALFLVFGAALGRGNPRAILETSIDLIILITIPLVIILRWLEKRRRSVMPERVYAVTNERLLYRLKDDVTTIRLEKLEQVSWSPDAIGGTIQFGTDFPRWIEVRDPQSVKELIEKARQDRQQEISHTEDTQRVMQLMQEEQRRQDKI